MDLLLVSHRGIASGIKSAVQMVMGPVADQITVMELTEEEGIEAFGKRLEEYMVSWLTEGKKGLVFADLKGGTPCNQAQMLLNRHGLGGRARVISGVNFPMVVEALFRDVDFESGQGLAEIVAAAKDGIECMEQGMGAAGSEDE